VSAAALYKEIAIDATMSIIVHHMMTSN
jgi:hypothetical protein